MPCDTRNAKGTDKLAQGPAERLNAGVVEQREEQESMFIGVYYLGHSRKGYEYRVITNAEGHELLATAADILNNPTDQGRAPKPTRRAPGS